MQPLGWSQVLKNYSFHLHLLLSKETKIVQRDSRKSPSEKSQQRIQKKYFKETQFNSYQAVLQKNLFWSQAHKDQEIPDLQAHL